MKNIIHQSLIFKQQFYVYLIVGLVLLVFGLFYLIHLKPIIFPLDDTYTVLHNAQVLHWGADPNYVGVPALMGSTSIMHVLLVSILLFCLDPLQAGLLVQWFSLSLYLFGLARLTVLFRVAWWQCALVLIGGLTGSYVSFHFFSGLETTLAMAAVVWSLIFAHQAVTTSQRVLLGMLCGCLPFIRPELGLWSILLLLYQVQRYSKMELPKKAIFYKCVQDVFVALLSALPWIICFWVNTGLLYPNTLAAKVAFTALSTEPFSQKWAYTKLQIRAFILDFGFLSVIGSLTVLLTTTLGRYILLFILGFFSFYLYYFSAGIHWNYWRYVIILLPFIFYGLLLGVTHPFKPLRLGSNLLLLALVIQAIILLPKHWKVYTDTRAYMASEVFEVAKWSKQHLPKNATLLIHDAGYIAFATSFHLIDLVGLKTPEIIHYHELLTLPSHRIKRVEALSRIMKANSVQFLIIQTAWLTRLNMMQSLTQRGWQFDLLRSLQPPSDMNFLIYKITLPKKE